MKFLKKE